MFLQVSNTLEDILFPGPQFTPQSLTIHLPSHRVTHSTKWKKWVVYRSSSSRNFPVCAIRFNWENRAKADLYFLKQFLYPWILFLPELLLKVNASLLIHFNPPSFWWRWDQCRRANRNCLQLIHQNQQIFRLKEDEDWINFHSTDRCLYLPAHNQLRLLPSYCLTAMNDNQILTQLVWERVFSWFRWFYLPLHLID